VCAVGLQHGGAAVVTCGSKGCDPLAACVAKPLSSVPSGDEAGSLSLLQMALTLDKVHQAGFPTEHLKKHESQVSLPLQQSLINSRQQVFQDAGITKMPRVSAGLGIVAALAMVVVVCVCICLNSNADLLDIPRTETLLSPHKDAENRSSVGEPVSARSTHPAQRAGYYERPARSSRVDAQEYFIGTFPTTPRTPEHPRASKPPEPLPNEVRPRESIAKFLSYAARRVGEGERDAETMRRLQAQKDALEVIIAIRCHDGNG